MTIFSFILISSLGLASPDYELKDKAQNSYWKIRLKEFVTCLFGERWASYIIVENEKITDDDITLPIIPAILLKQGDLKVYSKLIKGQTEFDILSPEKRRHYNLSFIKEIFFLTRKVLPEEDELSNWINALDQGGAREGIYQALVLDEVYSKLEASELIASGALIAFVVLYVDKFLNHKVEAQFLKKINPYVLKRIAMDKVFDVIEYFETRDLDLLYRWYAVISSYLAINYKDVMTSTIRKEESTRYHYEWAKKMPIQHIKSETIVKLYCVMNHLQER